MIHYITVRKKRGGSLSENHLYQNNWHDYLLNLFHFFSIPTDSTTEKYFSMSGKGKKESVQYNHDECLFHEFYCSCTLFWFIRNRRRLSINMQNQMDNVNSFFLFLSQTVNEEEEISET